MPEVEKLIGGPGDGVEVEKSDSPVMYGAWCGRGRLEVYERQADGRLHYQRTEIVGPRNHGIKFCDASSEATQVRFTED